ncbi:Vps51/Vps67 domain containing protein [Naviculisporaceae sp. PSN 640]
MSTIASPRDSPAPPNRRMNSSQALITPTSSTRPSLEISHSASSSPNPNTSSTTNPALPNTTNKRANRAALREYYNLQKAAATNNASSIGTPSLEITSDTNNNSRPLHLHDPSSYMPPSELDAPDFKPQEYISKTLSSSTLEELLRTYARVLGEIRALDAEKKALVYDNYSKLISATETIRKMQSKMDPLNPMASTLDVVVAKIYEQASGIREELRRGLGDGKGAVAGQEEEDDDDDRKKRRARTKALAAEVMEVPGRLRLLVEEGKVEEARRQWEMPRRLLERWKERALGGDDVDALIREGDSIIGSPGGSSEEESSSDEGS